MEKIVSALLVLAAAAGWSFPASAAKVLVPKDRVTVSDGKILVFGKAPAGSSVPWRAEGAGQASQGTATADDASAFQIPIRLNPGLNRLTVDGVALQVFVSSGAVAAPEGFAPLRVHAGDVSRCSVCHEGNFRLRAGGYPGVCLGCHVIEAQNPASGERADRNLHFKANISKCGRCHDAHAAANPKLLLAGAQQLCGACHPSLVGQEGTHAAYGEGGCTACHDSHFSGYPKILAETLPGVCHRCHEQGKGVAGKLHSPLRGERSCAACHDPHGRQKGLLVKVGSELCASCHAKVTAGGHGSELSDCLGCHDPHGSLGPEMVRKSVAERCGECHDRVADGKTVHKPVSSGCQQCHNPHRAGDAKAARLACNKCHDFKADSQTASLHGNMALPPESCGRCHPAHASQQDRLVRASIHFPLTQGKCAACHGRGDSQKLAVDNPAQYCRKCHPFEKDLTTRGARVHEPVAEGDCMACHEPHMSSRKGLVKASQGEVCGACHDKGQASGGRRPHTAVSSCTDCHSPHGGQEKLLTAKGEALCLGCHDDPRKAQTGAAIHAALDEGCSVCHDSHAGFSPGVLKGDTPIAVCVSCHEDHRSTEQRGGAAVDSGCGGCHEAHGSKQEHLLRPGPSNAQNAKAGTPAAAQ